VTSCWLFLNNYNDARNNECKMYKSFLRLHEKFPVNLVDMFSTYFREIQYEHQISRISFQRVKLSYVQLIKLHVSTPWGHLQAYKI